MWLLSTRQSDQASCSKSQLAESVGSGLIDRAWTAHATIELELIDLVHTDCVLSSLPSSLCVSSGNVEVEK